MKFPARPCNAAGDFLLRGAPPPPRNTSATFSPFADLESFTFAHHEFVKRQSSAEDINLALQTWATQSMNMTGINTSPFSGHDDMLKTIDSIKFGECSWSSFEASYQCPLDANSVLYMHECFTIHTRDVLEVA
jgi:hypothetical protein